MLKHRPMLRAGAALVAGLAVLVWANRSAPAAQLAISCGAVGQELELCREGVAAFEESTGHTVTIVSTPNQTEQRLALYQQLLAARSPDIDVLQIDVVWPGVLGRHFIDLSPHVPQEVIDSHFDAVVASNRVGGRLVALPWFLDVGLLYYRKDLLEKHGRPVPETWAALEETALAVQRAERAAGIDIWGYVFQARSYEGLTCNALEWLTSFGGGAIVSGDGEITVDNPRARAAVARAKGWLEEISPRGVLSYAEEEARGVFQIGRAVFMRNWPYAWSLAQAEGSAIRGKVGVARLPRGPGAAGRHTGALGGWQLAVSRYSKHREAAIALVRHLTSAREQKRRSLEASYNPTIPALYEDPELLKANPFYGDLRDAFETAVARPSAPTGLAYNRVSAAFWNTVRGVLTGREEVGPAFERLAARLELIRGEAWRK